MSPFVSRKVGGKTYPLGGEWEAIRSLHTRLTALETPAAGEVSREEWEVACDEIGMGGIFDDFHSAPDAIRQLGYYILDGEKALGGPSEGGSLYGRITALTAELKEARGLLVRWVDIEASPVTDPQVSTTYGPVHPYPPTIAYLTRTKPEEVECLLCHTFTAETPCPYCIKPAPKEPGGLVGVVTKVIGESVCASDWRIWEPESRAAIAAVADHLDELAAQGNSFVALASANLRAQLKAD